MRHRIFGKKLGRDIRSRKALLHNLASSLIVEGKITTTLAKAKFVKPFIDKLVTKAKKKTLHQQRMIASFLTPKAFGKLTSEIAPGFSARASGYTRITKLAQRQGDNALMVRLEFLKWDKSLVKSQKPKDTKIRNQRKIKAKEVSVKSKVTDKNEKH